MEDIVEIEPSEKVDALKKVFNNKFPYLFLFLFKDDALESFSRTGIYPEIIYGDVVLSDIMSNQQLIQVSMGGNILVSAIEKEFKDKYGIYVQVCYMNNKREIELASRIYDGITLNALNKKCEADGCRKVCL